MGNYAAAAWPWIWPTLLLIGLCLVVVWGSRYLVETFSRRIDVRGAVVRRAKKGVSAAGIVASLFAWARLAPLSEPVDRFLKHDLAPWLWPTLGMVIWLVGGSYVTRRVLTFAQSKARETKTRLDDALVAALGRPVSLSVFILGINLWSGLVPLPKTLQGYIILGSKGAIVLLFALFANGLAQAWLALRDNRSDLLATSRNVIGSAIKLVVYVIGVLMVLATVGVNITPLIASLGIGSLALGLALQRTLEDFLAGLLLAADQPARIGDFVDLESGESGWVLSIGWRTTHLKTRYDNHVIVPNSKLAQATLINRHSPSQECDFTVPVGVAYGSDLDQVVDETITVARTLLGNDNRGVTRYKPKVVFSTFGDSAVNFEVWLRASSWNDHFGLRSEFIKALHARYTEVGIEIPFPIRTIELGGDGALRVEVTRAAEAGGD